MKYEHGITLLTSDIKHYSPLGCETVSYLCDIPVFQWKLSAIVYCAAFLECVTHYFEDLNITQVSFKTGGSFSEINGNF